MVLCKTVAVIKGRNNTICNGSRSDRKIINIAQ